MSAMTSTPKETFTIDLVSPEEINIIDQVEILNLTTPEGEMGVMSGHIPMLVALVPSIITITNLTGQKSQYNISYGFADITSTKVTILVDKILSS